MKKILMVLMATLMVFSTFAAGKKEAAGKDGKKMDISIGAWDIGANIDPANKDALTKYIEDKFNINVIPRNFGWGDFSEKTLLWGAADDLPDVFASAMELTEVYYQWIDEGLVRAIPADMSKYPNLAKIIAQPAVSALRIDGKLYLYPRLNSVDSSYNSAERGIISRKDWRLKLGLPIPQTFEEYKALAQAFVDNDLDGNGKKDTVGMTFTNKDYTSMALLSSVPEAASKTWKFEDGKWIPGYASKDMIKGIKELNTLWKAGLIDGDLLSYTGKQGEEKFAQGNTGMFFTQGKATLVRGLSEKWAKYSDTNLVEKVEFLPLWKNSEGKRYAFHEGKNYWSSSYFSAKVTDEKMARIMELYDFLISKEGTDILKFGIPGVDFNMVDGKIVRVDSTVDLSKKYPSLAAFQPLAHWFGDVSVWEKDQYSLGQYPEDIMDLCIKQYEDSAKYLSPVNMQIQYLNTPNKAKFERGDSIFNSVLIAMLASNPEAEWNKQMAQLRTEGLDIAIAEVNAKAKELGIKNK